MFQFRAAEFVKLPPAQQQAFYASLSEAEADYLNHAWEFWARPDQLIPPGEWVYWLPLAGRGWGKTRTGAETVREWAKKFKYINLIGATADDVRDIMVEGESGILQICPKDERPRYVANRRLLEWPSGARSLLFSAEEPERLRGKQHMKLWCDELAAWRYPTQKPVALLERIVSASSNPGDVVLDPFCGCGTTLHAAAKLGRNWIGIDITHLAIALIERRLREAFPKMPFEVHGVPVDAEGARNLAERDKHEFQKWITAKIGAQPYKGGKKGMDRGIDGLLHFRDESRKPQFAVVSVKGGGIKSGDIRDLKGTMEREKAVLGFFLTLNPPTREMTREAAAAGIYETGGLKIARLQILTAAEIIAGKRPVIPFGHSESLKSAKVEDNLAQGRLL